MVEYLPEEIAFVRFCTEQDYKVICKRRRKACPAMKSQHCEEDNPLCEQMLAVMDVRGFAVFQTRCDSCNYRITISKLYSACKLSLY